MMRRFSRRVCLQTAALSLAAVGCDSARLGYRKKSKPFRENEVVMENSTQTEAARGTLTRMPTLFVGHGSPLNALLDNRWSQGFSALGKVVPQPRAILAVSAHWFVEGTFLTANAAPRTIHDFSGFPEALYALSYPAPGQPDLAAEVMHMLGDERAQLRSDWGFDHGTWSVLRFMYPEAKIPVIQLSVNRSLSPLQHIELGRSLSALREQGVLIFASGNVTHNLRDAMTRMQSGRIETPDWAARFDTTVLDVVSQHDTRKLASLWPDSDDGRMAHPTPDHFFPLLYAYGASDDRDAVQSPITGFDLGSLSMRAILFG
jgi:4,5-DOPA dioxygenase extradiol